MHLESTRDRIDATLEDMAQRLPAYGELAGRFGPLLREQAKLRAELAAAGIKAPAVDQGRLAAGAPVLADADLSAWAEPLCAAAGRILPVLADVLGLDAGALDRLSTCLADPDKAVKLARARIEGDWGCFDAEAERLGPVSGQSLRYIAENVFTPVFRAMIDGLDDALSDSQWEHGHCPACGSRPSIALLSPREATDLDLVGGGGKKYLHCPLCGQNWRFKRSGCPACGNEGDKTREVFDAPDRKFERIEACHACGSYLLCIDLRECIDGPDPDAVQMGLIHLDIHAQQQGFAPMTETMWNRLDS